MDRPELRPVPEIDEQPALMFPSDYRNRFHVFFDLMQKKVSEVLLVSSLYDDFILEEDGHLTDQIFETYRDLQLSSPPRITRVSSGSEAFDAMEKMQFDLIITMRRIGDMDPFSFGAEAKKRHPTIPILLLLSSYSELSYLARIPHFEGVDRIFVWNGDSGLLVSIIKLIEDEMNAERDTELGMVRVILVIEDSIQYYSLFLPQIYKEVVTQTQALMTEGLNKYHKLLLLRGRPKILLATTFEEGMTIYEKYKDNILGVISDVRFPRNGEPDPNAGVDFIKIVQKDNEYLPTLLQSSKLENRERASGINSFFLHKTSSKLLHGLQQFMKEYLGFGDFVFRLPNGKEVARAENMAAFEKIIKEVPVESILFHGAQNHFSNWLLARGEYHLAYTLKPLRIDDFVDAEAIKTFLTGFFAWTRQEKRKGIITDFEPDDFDPEAPFTRVGEGSLGGKGRGLAFATVVLSNANFEETLPDVDVNIPSTVVLCTGLFDKFIEDNDLFNAALDDREDEEIKREFLRKSLPKELEEALREITKKATYPLAVRSSSLLEDSQFQPFAGIYATYMLPNCDTNAKKRYEQLAKAVKLVYASTFSRLAKSYISTIGQKIEVEKMAVVIQRIVGKQYNDRFYPTFSGVAQSHNYYPVSYMKPEDGIAYVALGLGMTITGGGTSLRFCPKYPQVIPQFGTVAATLKNSQNEFCALRLCGEYPDLIEGEHATLETLSHVDAKKDGAAKLLSSTYDPQSDRIMDGAYGDGIPVITFAPILKQNRFPLTHILNELLSIGKESFACPVELEFAAVLDDDDDEKPEFKLLQLRPLVSDSDRSEIDVARYKEGALVYSDKALGNGNLRDIHDIVYVKPDLFDRTQTQKMRKEIAEINAQLADEHRHYVLIGSGRWGTRDRFLGIPVDWNDIYFARVLIEAGLKDFRVDPSQGMHFFVNVTSTGMGYLTVPYDDNESLVNWELLDAQPAVSELQYMRHVRFEEPLRIRLNGKTSEGVVAIRQPGLNTEDDVELL